MVINNVADLIWSFGDHDAATKYSYKRYVMLELRTLNEQLTGHRVHDAIGPYARQYRKRRG